MIRETGATSLMWRCLSRTGSSCESASNAPGNAINERLHVLMGQQGESGRDVSERIALNDALTTLTELHRIVYTRKPNTQVGGEGGRAAS